MKNINNMKVMNTNWCFKTLFVLLFVFGSTVISDAGAFSTVERSHFFVHYPAYSTVSVLNDFRNELRWVETLVVSEKRTRKYTNARVFAEYEIQCGNAVKSIMIPTYEYGIVEVDFCEEQ